MLNHHYIELKDYEEYLGKERLDRILSASETEADEKRAGRATLHYASWNNQRMLSWLPWSIWMYYQTVDRAENTLAALGVIGVMDRGGLLCKGKLKILGCENVDKCLIVLWHNLVNKPSPSFR
jgi:hypothetical protein